jgi:hypothetical protein
MPLKQLQVLQLPRCSHLSYSAGPCRHPASRRLPTRNPEAAAGYPAAASVAGAGLRRLPPARPGAGRPSARWPGGWAEAASACTAACRRRGHRGRWEDCLSWRGPGVAQEWRHLLSVYLQVAREWRLLARRISTRLPTYLQVARERRLPAPRLWAITTQSKAMQRRSKVSMEEQDAKRISTRACRNHWHAPTAASPGGTPVLHARTSQSPRCIRWPTPTVLPRCTCLGSQGDPRLPPAAAQKHVN